LKALVAGLGLLVVLGTALVIGVVIKRIYANPAPPSTAPAATPQLPVPGEAAGPAVGAPVPLPAGSKITGIAASGGVFAVTISGPAGDQVWLVNPSTGARVLALSAPK
jgi:hypothetical protein